MNPNGATTEYQFKQDNAGLPVRAALYPQGVSNSFDYELEGVKILGANLTDGRGIRTTTSGTGESQVNHVGEAVTRFEYDPMTGLKHQEIDPGGMIRTYFHDPNGNVVELVQTASSEGFEATCSTRARV